MNTKYINFSCPACSSEYEIFLKEIPYLMFMRCPHCDSALSCFEGEITVANDDLIKEIKHARSYSDIKASIKKHKEVSKKTSINVLDRIISEDDIVNLKIDLGLSKSSKDIIKVVDGINKK